ncbi:MAG: 23S rRNA (pseudouridine(1915)-N(3))-methyltransferase RlmH [Acidobacteriota bacterium]
MGRSLHVVWAGRNQRRDWEVLCAEYRKRIGGAVPIHDQPVRAKGRGGGELAGRRRAEAEALYAACPDPCWIIALDAGGKTRSSENFAAHLQRIQRDWPHPIAFLIGSDLGLDDLVLRRARERISLSPMTFGHELARLVLYEQIYRTISMDRGINYHRDTF